MWPAEGLRDMSDTSWPSTSRRPGATYPACASSTPPASWTNTAGLRRAKRERRGR